MKKPISATIDDSLIKWMNKHMKESVKFRNKSHLIETALNNLKKEEETK